MRRCQQPIDPLPPRKRAPNNSSFVYETTYGVGMGTCFVLREVRTRVISNRSGVFLGIPTVFNEISYWLMDISLGLASDSQCGATESRHLVARREAVQQTFSYRPDALYTDPSYCRFWWFTFVLLLFSFHPSHHPVHSSGNNTSNSLCGRGGKFHREWRSRVRFALHSPPALNL
jgi:hypothetical protein